jgi:hypothetical protein
MNAHLWERSPTYFPCVGKVENYKSWKDFSEGGCMERNCVFGNPLAFWNWFSAKNDDSCLWFDEEGNEIEPMNEEIKATGILILTFPYYDGNDLIQFKVRVKESDEEEIRKFIKEHQLKNSYIRDNEDEEKGSDSDNE